MGVDYAWEKFYTEIRLALVSDASPQERLGSLISGVSHLQRESFPDEHAWDEFRKLVNETTKRQAQMSDKEAKERLQAAFDIFSQVAKALGRTEFVI
jgi:hypothetical protein